MIYSFRRNNAQDFALAYFSASLSRMFPSLLNEHFLTRNLGRDQNTGTEHDVRSDVRRDHSYSVGMVPYTKRRVLQWVDCYIIQSKAMKVMVSCANSSAVNL
jgi:hypothetical protein